MKRIALSLATILTLAMFILGTTTARSAQKTEVKKATAFRGEIYDSACAEMGTHEQMKKTEGVTSDRDCTLKCVETGSKFVLYNAKTKKTYNLDDQAKAQEFAGEKVSVHGTLDSASNTIHVEKIETGGMHPKGAKKEKPQGTS